MFTPETQITVNLVDAQPSVAEKLLVMASAGTPPDASWFGVVADGSGGPDAARQGHLQAPGRPGEAGQPVRRPALLQGPPGRLERGRAPLRPPHPRSLRHQRPLRQPQPDPRRRGDHARGRELVDRRPGRSGAKTGAQRRRRVGLLPVHGYQRGGGVLPAPVRGRVLDEAGRRCLLETPEARAGLEWVANTRARFQVIDDLVPQRGPAGPLRGRQAGLLQRHPGGGGAVQEAGAGADRQGIELGVALMARGPGGRRGTQASGSGMGLTGASGTPRHGAAWEWLKFITSKETESPASSPAGPGAPGGARTSGTTPLPGLRSRLRHHPQGLPARRGGDAPAGDNRYVDLLKATTDELTPLFRGQTGVQDTAGKAVAACNAILGQ